jgi:hypothetical protein
MSKKDNNIRSIILTTLAVLLLLCLAKMPYGFYQIVRFLAFAGFGYLAYLEYKGKSIDRMVLFVILALLFQPFLPLSLGRVIWNIVDVVVALYLIYLLAKTHLKSK